MSNWRHKMNIKDYLADETTVEIADRLCGYVVEELTKIIERENRWQDKASPNVTAYYVGQLEQLKENFDMLIGSDDLSSWELEAEVNAQLDSLYDLGDTHIPLKNGQSQKFLWVGAI